MESSSLSPGGEKPIWAVRSIWAIIATKCDSVVFNQIFSFIEYMGLFLSLSFFYFLVLTKYMRQKPSFLPFHLSKCLFLLSSIPKRDAKVPTTPSLPVVDNKGGCPSDSLKLQKPSFLPIHLSKSPLLFSFILKLPAKVPTNLLPLPTADNEGGLPTDSSNKWVFVSFVFYFQ